VEPTDRESRVQATTEALHIMPTQQEADATVQAMTGALSDYALVRLLSYHSRV